MMSCVFLNFDVVESFTKNSHGSLTFPLLALALGLCLDVIARKVRLGNVRVPVTVFQFHIHVTLTLFDFAIWC